jgi:hypothetical protein
MYFCSDCKKSAILVNDELIKTCECSCGVNANMEAVAKGNTLVNGK